MGASFLTRDRDEVCLRAETFKRFPPGGGLTFVPTSSRAAALAGLGLYAPCRAGAVLAHRLAWVSTAVFGPGILPGRRMPWVPPIEPVVWAGLLSAWTQVVGAFDTFAVYERPAGPRPGLALLLIRGGRAVGFVKLRGGDADRMANEARALKIVAAARPRRFLVPELLDTGTISSWNYLITTAFQCRLHRVPRSAPGPDFFEDLQRSLAALPRPEGGGAALASNAW